MNPLLSFWIKVQPLSGSLGSHTWKAISQTSSLAPTSGDDNVVQHTTSSTWAFDIIKGAADRLLSHIKLSSSSWLLNPMISRMQDASAAPSPSVSPIYKPSILSNNKAICEAGRRLTQRRQRRSAVSSGVNATRSLTTKDTTTPLLQSQQLLQQQDYMQYQIPIQPIKRRNSGDWVREYKKERIDKINFNNVFGGLSGEDTNGIPILPPPASDNDNLVVDKVHSSEFDGSRNEEDMTTSKYVIHPPSPTCSSATVSGIPDNVVSLPSLSSSPSSLSHNNKSRSAAVTNVHDDMSTPSPNDVICGRGGKANTHQGNISFREEAKKLRSWYESSSKSEKFTISSFLVDIVRERGGRFLKRDTENPGQWTECDGNDVRKKASQALREGRQQRARARQ